MSLSTDRQYFSVIDTETNWQNKVMSIGIVIAKKSTCRAVVEKYYVMTPECTQPAMYAYALNDYTHTTTCERSDAISDLHTLLHHYYVIDIFAYHAQFDSNHLPELEDYIWHDIMRIAAYKQYNHSIPTDAECCSTGRLRSNYGVEPILQLLLKDPSYHEKHNAMCDAKDELMIMQMLGRPPDQYPSIQELRDSKAPHKIRKAQLQERLLQGDIDLVSFESTRNLITIKCNKCEHIWNVSYSAVKKQLSPCPNCSPLIEHSTRNIENASLEQSFLLKAKNYTDLISTKSHGRLKVLDYKGSNQKVTAVCLLCSYSWEARADRLQKR